MYVQISDAPYRIDDLSRVMTPALAIFPEIVEANIDVTLRLLGGDANRWRPHVKTAKLGYTMRRLVERGVRTAKCATTLELLTACEAGADDVLLAYSVVGANAARVREIAAAHPRTKVSVLVETPEQAAPWMDTGIGVFLDVNSGMNRTGIEQDHVQQIVSLARAAGDHFRGLHYYDGHMHILDPVQRQTEAWAGYDKLMDLVAACEAGGAHVGEVITSGTPALPCGAGYARFQGAGFVHRVSPGTVVYNDATSLEDLPGLGYQAAVVVLTSVVSHPIPGRFTCDAGHKAVSADAGVPTCVVAGHAGFDPLKPSEEHLPIDVPAGGGEVPAIGTILRLVPRHVCPTVNNFDHALIVEGGRITRVEPVTARGREKAWRV